MHVNWRECNFLFRNNKIQKYGTTSLFRKIIKLDIASPLINSQSCLVEYSTGPTKLETSALCVHTSTPLCLIFISLFSSVLHYIEIVCRSQNTIHILRNKFNWWLFYSVPLWKKNNTGARCAPLYRLACKYDIFAIFFTNINNTYVFTISDYQVRSSSVFQTF